MKKRLVCLMLALILVMPALFSAQALTDRQCHLMGVDSGSLAIAITSTAWDQKQFPLEYTISLYPIAKNEFELKVKA